MDSSNATNALATLIALGMNLIFMAVMLVFGILVVIAVCKLFTKAGEKWWAGLIPFYSTYKMVKIGLGITDSKAAILFILMFVPILGYVIQAYMYFGLLKSFGTSNIASAVLAITGLAGFYIVYLGLSNRVYYRGPLYRGADMFCPPLGI